MLRAAHGCIVMLPRKTLSETPRPLYHWKAEVLSFLHVLLVWGVNLASLLNKRRQSWTIHLKQMVDGIQGLADKEIKYESSAKTQPLTTCELLYATPFFPIVTIL